ncbi:hypothetical protein ACJX0J_036237, partial [Zea mays]
MLEMQTCIVIIFLIEGLHVRASVVVSCLVKSLGLKIILLISLVLCCVVFDVELAPDEHKKHEYYRYIVLVR